MIPEIERFALAAVAMTTRALSEVAGPSEITFLGWRTLVILGDEDEPLRLREIAERLGASAPSTSRLVRRLERRGLVSTAPDAVDGRGVRVGLSPQGAALRHAVLARRRQMLEQSLAEPLPREAEAVVSALADRLSQWA